MFDVKIVVAPSFKFLIVGFAMFITGLFKRFVKMNTILKRIIIMICTSVILQIFL